MSQTQMQKKLQFQVPQHDLDLYGVSGPVSSMTLLSNWTESSTKQLKAATQRVVDKNPYLAGAIKQGAGDAIMVEARTHTEFVLEIDGPSDFVAPTPIAEAVEAVQGKLEPLFAAHTIGGLATAKETGGPLFRITLMQLPGQHAAMQVEANHMIADGATYYKLLDLVDCAVNGRAIPELKWEPASESVPLPSHYTEEEKAHNKSGWVPGFIATSEKYAAGTLAARVPTIKVVNKEAAAALKAEYGPAAKAQGLPFLSTNDLITAGCCELADEGGMGLMFASLRGRMAGISTSHAGNFERGVSFPADKAAANPAFVRSLSKNWCYYGLEGNERLSDGKDDSSDATKPWNSLANSNFALVTNWSSLTYFIQPPGTKVVCHCAAKAFVTELSGIDATVVFKADAQGTTALLTNHLSGKRGEELKGRIANSKIFRRLFEPAGKPAPAARTNSEVALVATAEDSVAAKPSWLGFPLPTVALASGLLAGLLHVSIATRG